MKSNALYGKSLLILIVAFIVSIAIRLPNLNRPLSKHHEFNTAFLLIPMEIWYANSASFYHYSPVLNYENSADKGINNFAAANESIESDYYYLSFGAGAYLIPYFFLCLFGAPTIVGLQLFSLLVHFLCAWTIVKISRFFLNKYQLNSNYDFLSGVIYLFLPITLWFHGNGFTHHSLAVLFFLASIYQAILLFEFPVDKKKYFYLFLFLSLTIYTEWIGCFLVLGIVIQVLIKRNRTYWRIALISSLSLLATLVLIVFQYSSIYGYAYLYTHLNNRFWMRTNIDDGFTSYLYLTKKIIQWYLIGYAPLLLFIVLKLVRKGKTHSVSIIKECGALLVLPLLFHHLLFSDFTSAHDYSVLIDGGLICIFLNLILAEFLQNQKINKFAVLFGFFFLLCIGQYYWINRPGELAQNGDRYTDFKDLGTYIRKHAKNDEVIFIQNLPEYPNPQVVYYAHRNFYSVDSYQEMEGLIRKRKESKVFFIELQGHKIKHDQHLFFEK